MVVTTGRDPAEVAGAAADVVGVVVVEADEPFEELQAEARIPPRARRPTAKSGRER